MTKIDIISGFLGAGKTTLIKKLVNETLRDEKLVIIENEFGEIGIDGGFLKEAGVQVTEMNSGCICCSLVGDFGKALEKVIHEYNPDRVIIEPSGVGKLSDVIAAVKNTNCHDAELNSYTAVVDAKKCKIYHKNFGEFFNNQIENASTIILSHTNDISQEKLQKCVEIVTELNPNALIVTTDWSVLSGEKLLDAIENSKKSIETTLDIHHHHHDHDEHCECGCHDHEHHHDHDEHCECGCHDHGHHHHDHDEHCECGCHDHEHHHDHDEHCECGCHDHEHHHHDHDEHCECGCHDHDHHADEIFTSWGIKTATKFTKEHITQILNELMSNDEYGVVLRAKGIVDSENEWIHFDYIPGEPDVRTGNAEVTGCICVIGSKLNTTKLEELFK